MIRREIDYGSGLAALVPALPSTDFPCLLESRLTATPLGRYSLLSWRPTVVFEAFGDRHVMTDTRGRREGRGDPWAVLARLHRARCRAPVDTSFPSFAGAVGFASYESGLEWERIAPRHADELGLPDLWFGFYDVLLVADEVERRLWIVADAEDSSRNAALIERTLAEVAELRVQAPAVSPSPASGAAPESNLTREAYDAAVRRIRDYIASGDVYQVNLAQRFSAPLPTDGAWGIYTRLRDLSAAPFALYLDLGYAQVAGSSPERFLKVRGRQVSTRPIKGTRPRGADEAEDRARRDELVASVKDRAELLMIVDLERNDLGRVCVPGSIQVSDLYQLEQYPTVHHLVAEVAGTLLPGLDVFDALRATFPGGSITGAPKVRAMQVINELEPSRRNLYTGAMGYLGFRGDSELNIAIRTVQCARGKAWFHAGSGIVWDSTEADEYAETLAKARALSLAVTGRPPGGLLP